MAYNPNPCEPETDKSLLEGFSEFAKLRDLVCNVAIRELSNKKISSAKLRAIAELVRSIN